MFRTFFPVDDCLNIIENYYQFINMKGAPCGYHDGSMLFALSVVMDEIVEHFRMIHE